MSETPYRELGISGSGAIATGLAAVASARAGRIRILARSEPSAQRAMLAVEKTCSRIEGADPSRVSTGTAAEDLATCDLIIEAIVEDFDTKAGLLAAIGDIAPASDLATTTSSLSVTELGKACGHPERLFGLHVFNPVPVLNLVELCLPPEAGAAIAERAEAWCACLGKTAVRVPDTPGFVVNRLLFPYLFDAVRFMEECGMAAADVDTCMSLGAAHPMGPLALLDLIGLDVAVAIGQALNAESGKADHLAPAAMLSLVEAGNLGRKTGRGFFNYT
jgi:3-hydroxybutyryl-CoA dehydrogenase